MMHAIIWNEYCLGEIFKYCTSIQDQIALIQACDQFKAIIQQIWSRDWKELHLQRTRCVVQIEHHNGDKIDFADMDVFKSVLELLQCIVQKIFICRKQTEHMWSVLSSFRFDKVTELHLIHTGVVSAIGSCFPNLCTLILAGKSRVINNPKLSALENLDVSSSNMKIEEILKFVSQLKLKRLKCNDFHPPKSVQQEQPIPIQSQFFKCLCELEELGLYYSGINEFMDGFSVMQKLKRVTVNFYDWIPLNEELLLVDLMSERLKNRVTEFTACFHLPEYYSKALSRIKKQVKQFGRLRKLPLTHGFNDWCDDLKELSKEFPMLKAMYFQYACVEAEDLMNILRTKHQLDLIEFQNCHVECDGGPICLDVEKIAKHRLDPITINVCESSLDIPKDKRLQITLSAPSELIKITNNLGEDITNQFIYILD